MHQLRTKCNKPFRAGSPTGNPQCRWHWHTNVLDECHPKAMRGRGPPRSSLTRPTTLHAQDTTTLMEPKPENLAETLRARWNWDLEHTTYARVLAGRTHEW